MIRQKNSGIFFRSYRHELPGSLVLSYIVSRAEDSPEGTVYGYLTTLFIMVGGNGTSLSTSHSHRERRMVALQSF